MKHLDDTKLKIAIIGLGYVGLPLAIEFDRKFTTMGFDVNSSRIDELKSGIDSTLEVNTHELESARLLTYTDDLQEIADCNVYIITVPTPIDGNKQPDLSSLKSASATVGTVLTNNDVVIYESTVYPGATEEVCVPILEQKSGLNFNQNFYVGYSPERINPGDREHRITSIKKVTSGSTPKVAEFVDALYQSIIVAGTYKTSSIKVAEAAKVIENTQRDINVALINELALIFNLLDIDTEEVLLAAGTKWNFLPFRPGLVGGHCIGVDPYYLTHKASEIGYHPEIILAGRRLNDSMGKYIADQVVKLMAKNQINALGANVLILGLTFKENCPDLRNTRVIDIVGQLRQYHCCVDVFDPWPNKDEARLKYNIKLLEEPKTQNYDVVILAVGHDYFKDLGVQKIRQFGKENHVVYDVKYVLTRDETDDRL